MHSTEQGQRIADLVTQRYQHEQALDAETEALKAQKAAAADTAQETAQLGQQLGSAFSDAFSGFLQDLKSGKSGVEALQNALSRLADQLLNMVVSNLFSSLLGGLGFAGGGEVNVPSFASGGRISGPGSGTSDSILARVSDGEHIIRAKQAKRFRPLLEAINSGAIDRLPAFAAGGAVGGASAAMMAGSVGGNQTVNFAPVINVESKASGDPVADAKQAKAIGDAVEDRMRHLVVNEMMRQQRPGGILRR
ncbi:hypothetical protein DLJ53_25775 [Acuticoccus sediminis]|uniref:Phage tail tape measure protein, lambda family n=1 Tax=Acuticoccus sediminis TaxID=2184697 RepID=A0A8B2NLQ6_9HYPH|nr:hypothetical protein [Acuticoccus sediminis]RAH99035.1 hypothetical protein DLJ53_25775 [Acuticoccus sediminis]